MIDLHTHTNHSDGSLSPAELVDLAVAARLEALAITDHDTLAGYELALPVANARSLELVAGIELSTDYHGRSVHVLAYFFDGGPAPAFPIWLDVLQQGRHTRNRRLVDVLQQHGFDITMDEVKSRGRHLPGRPHFAALMVEKGYVQSVQEAFEKYLADGRECFVPRDEPGFAEAVSRVRQAGGVTSLAHPVRLSRDDRTLRNHVAEMKEMGLQAIEVLHSDHSARDTERHAGLARDLCLAQTGGSDFHGAAKPHILLGSQSGVQVPKSFLDDLRRIAT